MVSGSTRMGITAAIRRDVVPGVVVLPANSTETPAWDLADRDGHFAVTLEVLERAADAESADEEVAGEVA